MHLFFTDFIKNRTIQLAIVLGIIFDLLITKSIRHILVLFGLPYLISIALVYLMNKNKIAIKPQISAQYKRVHYKNWNSKYDL